MEKIEKAQRWAQRYHKGQYRKLSGYDYIVHPEYVAMIVSEFTDDEDVISAAWLHDVVEDSDVTLEDVEKAFGPRVAHIVKFVTKVSKKSDGDRQTRTDIDLDHYKKGPIESKLIKLADTLHNLPTMIRDVGDADFYVREKDDLIHEIGDANHIITEIIKDIIKDYDLQRTSK